MKKQLLFTLIVGGAVVGTVVGRILGASGEHAGKLGALSGGLNGAGAAKYQRTRVVITTYVIEDIKS